ncbi:MAG: NUDIX domain-containing protein [Leptospiraceae bacterium]|nr:NUDIX domain-containing protein [Leptospiraceae bacterium]
MNYQNSVVILIVHKNHLLLQYNPKWNDFSFIGGKLEPNETPMEAAYREVEEELQLTRSRDFVLEEWKPQLIEFEKMSKRTNSLTHYKIYLYSLLAQRNFLVSLQTNKNLWIPVEEIQKGESKENVSELVKDVLSKITIHEHESFKDLV